MSIAGLIAALILTGVLALWVAAPFLRRNTASAMSAQQSRVGRQRERLQVYYARVLRNLHDLDEDYATGKLDEADYRADRALWVERGAQVLQALDRLDAQHLIAPLDADEAAIDDAIDRTIEAAVQAYRGAAQAEA